MGNRLKEFRTDSGLTQIQLAQMLSVTSDYISMVERGTKIQGFTLAKKISNIFMVNIETNFFEEK